MKSITSKAAAALFGMFMLSNSANAQMVISKVFYAGTTQAGGTKNYGGGEEYIELHNNSAKEVDIAGMCIALVESESSTGAYLASERESGYEVKLKQVFQIPEDKEFVVAPWGNVVIAACAMDHSKDAENGPDLSKADFTFGNMTGDAEGVTPLNLLFTFNASTKALNLTNGGDASIMIISKKNASKLTYADESTYVFANGKEKGSQYLPFNAYYAMDAVEILKTKDTDGVYAADAARKRFSDSQDKGFVPANQKMLRDGYVAYRKTALNNNGEIYLYDTQDSSVDFQISNTIGVGEYDTTESGVTEVTVNIPESGFLPFYPENYFFTNSDLYIGYVSISNGTLNFNSVQGNTVIANTSAYLLIGAPGEHVVKYSQADRTLASAGQNMWISDDESKYVDGVLTITTKNRYPMKFVNEKGNVRFVRDMVDNNPQTMKIDIEKEGRFYINLNYLNEEETVIPWAGIMPDEISTAVQNINTVTDCNVYNMQGMKMNSNNLPAGLYIKGGKKIVVK